MTSLANSLIGTFKYPTYTGSGAGNNHVTIAARVGGKYVRIEGVNMYVALPPDEGS